jgi:hypothetical protein
MGHATTATAVLVAALAAPALAGVAVGDAAPAIAIRECVNAEPFTLEDLRGQIVVIEIFRTSSKPSVEQSSRLDEFQSRYEGRNVFVVSVTNEDRKRLDEYLTATKPAHVVAIESGDSAAGYGLVKGFPTLYVVDPDGKIAWAGNWIDRAEAEAAKLFRAAKSWPPRVPTRLAAAREAVVAGRLGEGRRALDAELKTGKPTDAEKVLVQRAIAWIDAQWSKQVDAAAKTANDGKYYDAVVEFERVVKEAGDLDPGRRAAEGVRQVLADPGRKREVDAGRALATATEAAKSQPPKKAIALYKAVIAKWKDTEAAKRAAEMVAELEK